MIRASKKLKFSEYLISSRIIARFYQRMIHIEARRPMILIISHGMPLTSVLQRTWRLAISQPSLIGISRRIQCCRSSNEKKRNSIGTSITGKLSKVSRIAIRVKTVY